MNSLAWPGSRHCGERRWNREEEIGPERRAGLSRPRLDAARARPYLIASIGESLAALRAG